jgi:hypothetical protein
MRCIFLVAADAASMLAAVENSAAAESDRLGSLLAGYPT